MSTEYQTVDEWFPILGWTDLPNFGLIHTLPEAKQFIANYYAPAEVERVLHNFFVGLRGEYQLLNLRIMGAPGAGKTTFLYYLKALLEINPELVVSARYYIHIAHVQALIYEGKVDENEVLEDILKAFTEFFNHSGLSEIAEDFNGEGTTKRRVRKFTDFYKDNKKKFRKILVYALDDVDNATDDQVLDVSRFLYEHLEVASVKKWLSIREVTYNAIYSAQTRDYLQNFYTDRLPFPSISLYGLMSFRISKLGKGAKNPFSEALCQIVEDVHLGHLRLCLSTLRNLIMDIQPKGFKVGTDIAVIRKYMEKSSYITFFRHGVFPNIHDPIYRMFKNIPTLTEILLLLKHTSRTDEFLLGILNDVISAKVSSIPDMRNTEYRITSSDFNDSIKFLIDHELITKTGKARCILTSKGEMTCAVANTPYFIGLSQEAMGHPVDMDLYWKIVKMRVDYNYMVLDKLDWYREGQARGKAR